MRLQRAGSNPPVHPHACGEHARLTRLARLPGSPPRLWGIPPTWPQTAPPHGRFTPTPVGNTVSAPVRRPAATVHPHACGEHVRKWADWPIWCAVHPHACGEHGQPPRSPARLRSVHPHACGEHGSDSPAARTGCGSPPRLWGMPAWAMRHSAHLRFTPTPVGNTHRAAAIDCFWYGSPPRLWGMPTSVIVSPAISVRFTPTPVGNTCPSRRRRAAHRRFTPTPVGNTQTAPSARIAAGAVHPHACGECATRICLGASVLGSPPRLWGIRSRCSLTHAERRHRFTPTPVGNTR